MDSTNLDNGIMRRLSAVDFRSGYVNREAVEVTLHGHLSLLGLAPRPVTWAKDGDDAQRRVANAYRNAVAGEVDAALEQVCKGVVEEFDSGWRRPRDEAKTAGRVRQLDAAQSAVCWHSVKFSIPWRLYRPGETGERGRHSSSEFFWRQGGDALEYAARAHAERTWAHQHSGTDARPSNEAVWLPFVDAFADGLWLFWITDSDVIALPRPALRLDGEQVHSAAGPALTWPGSEESYYFLNDVHVPKLLVETPANQLDPRMILRETNVGVRREIVRKLGIERICDGLGAQSLDRQGDYELLLLDLQDGRRRPFLKMRNPSMGVYHIEGVAPECHTVAEALAWRNQSDVPPSVLT